MYHYWINASLWRLYQLVIVKIILLCLHMIVRVDTERVMEYGMNSDEIINENSQN